MTTFLVLQESEARGLQIQVPLGQLIKSLSQNKKTKSSGGIAQCRHPRFHWGGWAGEGKKKEGKRKEKKKGICSKIFLEDH